VTLKEKFLGGGGSALRLGALRGERVGWGGGGGGGSRESRGTGGVYLVWVGGKKMCGVAWGGVLIRIDLGEVPGGMKNRKKERDVPLNLDETSPSSRSRGNGGLPEKRERLDKKKYCGSFGVFSDAGKLQP